MLWCWNIKPFIVLIMEPLNFTSFEFRGVERVEPPNFDVNVKKYEVYRKVGSDLAFRAVMNRPPVERTEDNSWCYRSYPNFTHEMIVYGDMYKSFWSPNNWTGINAGPAETEVCICCELSRTSDIEGEKSLYITLNVHTEPLSEEQPKACSHPSTRTSEGQCWGGGSGSCTVEIITSCSVCNATLSTHHDHRD